MTFEEQITKAFETLTDRLRGEIDQQVQRTAAELVAAAPAESIAAVSPAAIVAPAADAASVERLAENLRAIERARSLTDILDTLIACAREDASDTAVWLIHGGRLHQWRASGSGAAYHSSDRAFDEGGVIAEAARTNAVAREDGSLAVPMAIAGHVVAVLVADVGEPRTSNVERRTTNLEILTRYAARSLEALTAFKTARALTQRPEPATGDASQVVPDETRAEQDTSARRYARLLVSEIKLYHESEVVDGLRDRDLATRLGGEIARARVMYEERVPSHVRARAEYFQDELVRTLASGDASLLELRTEN